MRQACRRALTWVAGTLIVCVFVWPSVYGGEADRSASSSSPQAPCFDCTLVIGYSQVGAPRGGWFVVDGAFLSEVDGDRWQLLWHGGAGVDRWSQPDYRGWDRPIISPCATGADAPDRIVLSISGPFGSNETRWAAAIERTIEVIQDKYPSARQIVLQPVVGGPEAQACPAPQRRGGRRANGRVRASWQHQHIVHAIEEVVAAHNEKVDANGDPSA